MSAGRLVEVARARPAECATTCPARYDHGSECECSSAAGNHLAEPLRRSAASAPAALTVCLEVCSREGNGPQVLTQVEAFNADLCAVVGVKPIDVMALVGTYCARMKDAEPVNSNAPVHAPHHATVSGDAPLGYCKFFWCALCPSCMPSATSCLQREWALQS